MWPQILSTHQHVLDGWQQAKYTIHAACIYLNTLCSIMWALMALCDFVVIVSHFQPTMFIKCPIWCLPYMTAHCTIHHRSKPHLLCDYKSKHSILRIRSHSYTNIHLPYIQHWRWCQGIWVVEQLEHHRSCMLQQTVDEKVLIISYSGTLI